MTPDVLLLKDVKKNMVDNFLKKHETLFKEREDAKASEGEFNMEKTHSRFKGELNIDKRN